MNLQQFPRVSNSGFLNKKVTVTYSKPVTQWENLGSIPQDGFGPELATPFVPSSKEKPALLPGYAMGSVIEENPKLDGSGKPVMETVTETFRVPGPKAEALAEAATSTVLGAAIGAFPGAAMMAFGIFASLIGGANAASILDASVGTAIGGAALGGTIGLGIGAGAVWKSRSRVNTLEWEQAPLEHQSLKGYNVHCEPAGSGNARTTFSPAFESRNFGTYAKPVKNYSDW